MAELTTEVDFEGTLVQVFEGIRQYTKYPQYLTGVTATEVLPATEKGSVCRVRYDLKLIKSFFYTLNMYEDSPRRIWWTLEDSNLMKQSNGSWTFAEIDGGHTKAIYSLDVAFRGLIPNAIVDQVTKANLPAMMKGFQKLITEQRSRS